MAIVEAINIPIGVTGQETVQQAANSYEDLGDAVAKTQLEAERLAQQFGINDAKTQEAIKVAGRYKQEMEQLDFAIDGARGGVDQMFRATQGVVAGLEIAAGAAGLFGSESEELEKVLIKVQGAMALSQGLKDFQEFLPAIKNVSKSVTGSLTTAFKGFGKAARTAIASTGIGLLVVAVGALVAYWDDIKEAVSGVSEEQKKLLKDQELSVEAAKKQLDDISAQENILRQQGKTEQEILKLKISATKNTIIQLEAQIQQQKIIKEQQVQTAKRNKDILSGILQFVQAPLYILLKGIDAALNAFGKESDLANQFADFGASLLFDPEQVETEADAAIAAQEKELQTMKNNLAGYEMSITKIRKDNYKTQQDDLKKAKEEEQKQLDDEFEAWQNQELAKYEYRQELAAEQEKRRQQDLDDEEEMFNAELEYEVELAEMKLANAEYVKNRKKEIDEEALKDAKDLAEKQSQIQEDSIKALTDLISSSNSFLSNQNNKLNEEFESRINQLKELGHSQEEIANMRDAELQNIDARAKKNFEIAKKLQYAQTLISTIEGTQNAFTTAQKSPLTALFPAYPYIQAATAGAFGIAQLQQISQSSYDSKLKPSVSTASASASVPRFNAPTTRLPQTDEFTQVRRVYVTERDITNVQDKVKVTESLSQF